MRNLLLALLVILVAGSGAVFFSSGWNEDETESAPGTSPLDEDYDYYIGDMRATRFDRDGQPVSRLQAERVTHYPDGDRAELQEPEFDMLGAEGASWQASADRGTLTPDPQRGDDRLELAGQVELHKSLRGGDFVDLRTTALTVFIDSEEAASLAPVELQMRNTRLQGVGMQARLAENFIQLNDGNGSHDPTTRR